MLRNIFKSTYLDFIMGIKFTGLVPRKEISFDDLKGKKIAIDASNMLYQFLSSIRQKDGTPLMDSEGNVTSHLMGIFSRLTNLMNRDMKLAVVFDGKPPLLKLKEQEEREHRKRVAEAKMQKALEEEEEEEAYKYAKQTSRLTRVMVEESKELVSALGMPVIQAPSEAEAQAAFICEKGDVWAVASSDMDCLVYGAPRMIPNLTLSQKRKLPSGGYVITAPEMFELKDVLNTLGINKDQLLVLGILIGTDYNIGGVKGIGPKTALKLVKQYKNFDELFEQVKPDFNWKEIYAVFKSMPIMKNYQLKWKDVDADKVKEILVERHEFNEERVENGLKKLKKEIDETKKKKSQKGLGDFF